LTAGAWVVADSYRGNALARHGQALARLGAEKTAINIITLGVTDFIRSLHF